MKFYNLIVILFLGSSSLVYGQSRIDGTDEVKVERADQIEGGTFDGQKINRYKGNVVFNLQGALMYCDSAYQYSKKYNRNEIEAFGHVKIVQGESFSLSGDRLHYNADSRMATMRGRVVLKKNNKVKRVNFLKYKLK